MEALANLLDGKVSKQAISKYENGVMLPSMSLIVEMAKVLNVDTDFFYREISPDLQNLEISFRKKSGVRAKDENALTAAIKDDIERFLEVKNILGIKHKLPSIVHSSEVLSTYEQMTQCAVELRELWGIGKSPINNIQDLLESHGIIVIYSNSPEGFDGVSGKVNETTFIMVLNINVSMVERQRFTAMHELGHLLFNERFDKNLTKNEKEKMCHAFASEMLLPGSVLMDLFKGKAKIDITEFEFVQRQYGISIDAIVHKLSALQLFSDKRYRAYQIRKQRSSYLKERLEKSRFQEIKTPRFKTMVYRALASGLITDSKAASLLRQPVDIIQNNTVLL